MEDLLCVVVFGVSIFVNGTVFHGVPTTIIPQMKAVEHLALHSKQRIE